MGKVLEGQRQAHKLTQAVMAQQLGVSQSAYSRLEAGDSVINVAQLRKIAECLGSSPSELLARADELAFSLRTQGVNVLHEKPTNPAAVAIGMGLLAALLFASKS